MILILLFLLGLLYFPLSALPYATSKVNKSLILARVRLEPLMATSLRDVQAAVVSLQNALHQDSSAGILTTAALSAVALSSGAIYVQIQIETAKLLSKIPAGASIVKLYPGDARNVFFLPKDSTYTAVVDESKQAKLKNLIADTVRYLYGQGTTIKGSATLELRRIPRDSVDCVISTGALSGKRGWLSALTGDGGTADETAKQRAELIKQAYRILKPGGAMLLVEPDREDTLMPALSQVFTTPLPAVRSVAAGRSGMRARDRRASAVAGVEQTTVDGVGNSARVINDMQVATGNVDAVVCERMQNILFPFVVGAAIKL